MLFRSIANLDHLMETPAGQKLKNSYPEAVWQTLLTDGRQYLLPGSMVLPPDLTANYWINRPLAEQYGIDTENWRENIWNHREKLFSSFASFLSVYVIISQQPYQQHLGLRRTERCRNS